METTWTPQMCMQTCTVSKTMQERLRMRRRTPECIESNKRCKTHLKRPKMGCPSPPLDGERPVSTISTYTCCGTCLLRHQVKYLRSDHLRVESRQLCPALRMRELATETVTEMEAMVTWMARLVVAAST